MSDSASSAVAPRFEFSPTLPNIYPEVHRIFQSDEGIRHRHTIDKPRKCEMKLLLFGVFVLVCLVSVRGQCNTGNSDCVPYYLCESDGTTIASEETNLTDVVRITYDDCPGSIDICCKKSNQIKLDQTSTTPATTPYTSVCGQRNPQGVGFTIMGDSEGEAQFGEFPWMVALLLEEEVDGIDRPNLLFQCGGSLIHPQVVLTSAHCVINRTPQKLKVRAGEWDTQTKSEILSHQDRSVSQVIMHEDYNNITLHNEIALVILHDPVNITEHVDVVCLPSQGQNLDHSRCFASGWGKKNIGKEARYQVILKKVELLIVPQPTCLASLRETLLGRSFELHKSFICAGGEGNRHICKGDEGGPLVCPLLNDPLHYQQAGIVARTIGCGETETPSLYSNVALFRNWIEQKLSLNNFTLA